MEIIFDILSAIQEEAGSEKIRLTRVQVRCKMAYDKMMRYVKEMIYRKMILPDYLITDYGRKFLNDFRKINDFFNKMKIEYFGDKVIG